MAGNEATKDTSVFDAYILLSEPVQFHPSEIREALKEEFPAIDIRAGGMSAMLDKPCDTADFITQPLYLGAEGADAQTATLIRLPGYGTWDPAQIPKAQRLFVPDLAERLSRNASYICISVGGAGAGSLTDRFRAARLCSCIAAVFARLPVAVAAYWQTGDHFLTPEQVSEMADRAMRDDWPVDKWIGLNVMGDPELRQSGAMTRGLRYFTDYEISHASAPIPPGEAAAFTLSAATMARAYGSAFNDGDLLGNEGQSREESYRIRHVPKGTEGSICDVKLMVHPQNGADHEALAGPIQSRPPPPGVDNRRVPPKGFFKRMIRGARAN